MNTTSQADVSCAVFGGLTGLRPNAITRFVVGLERSPRPVSADEAKAELGDSFARLLLLSGTFPTTAEAVLAALKDAAGDGDPLGEPPRSFILGEGSQFAGDEPGVDPNLRFLVAVGFGQEGPDVIISTPSPESGFVELMAWDDEHGGFNFYRTVGDEGAWVFAGNSRHALTDPTRGKGPFESHPSGAVLMKELEIPWLHWHSFEALMPASVFTDGDPRRRHPWFTDKRGAEVCETQVAIPSMERWAKQRFGRVIAGGGTFSDPRRVLEQVLGTPTVNLVSSRAESRDPRAKSGPLPPSFFFSANALTNEPIGLASAPPFDLPIDHYLASLETFAFVVSNRAGFVRKGDTRFAFFVPERAREDDVALREAIAVGLITTRLAASLLMVDFPNPIFSARREALLAHVPSTATVVDGASGFSQEMADNILASAPGTSEGSPEREFADRWNVGDAFVAPFAALLATYFEAVVARLRTSAGFDDYVRLAESRRNRVKSMPIFENAMLFATTNIENESREMRPDGTVAVIER